jgi:2-hydroxychromene-2-carboxylate isomerase
MPRVTFYFDLGSPYAYLAAERLGTVLPEPVAWQPVLLGGLFKMSGRSSWALGDYRRRETGMAEIERRASAYGLAPMVWPDPWPSDYLAAMLATTLAFELDHGRDFTLQAFRNAFQRGWELSMPQPILDTAREVGIAPERVAAARSDAPLKRALRTATEDAFELGVIGVPTVAVGEELFWGDDRLEDAAAHLRSVTAAQS